MTDTDTEVTGWVGWGVFAAVILIIAGIIDAIHGITAIFGTDTIYVIGETALFSLDVQAWGWWHLILGILLVLVGIALLGGATWARVVAIVLVSLNAIGQLTLLTAQPWWSIIVLTLDVLVIYALTVHGRELKARNG